MNRNLIKNLSSVLLLSLLISSCSPEKFISNWNEDAIVIDGEQSDWKDKLNYLEDESVAVGIFNDNENLYVCLTTEDRVKIQQILDPGLTLWIKPNNGSVMAYGISYPLRSEDFEMKSAMEMRMDSYEQDYLKNLLAGFHDKQTELQIINEKNYSLYTFQVNNGSGIRIKIGESMNQLVYEAAVPIAENNKGEFRIELFPGEKLRIGFESNKVERPKGKLGTGGRTGVPGAEIYGRPEPIDIEINVTLAKSP